MSKEWILNMAINRWGLQKKKNVGTVSEEIRKCSPKTIEEWKNYYYKNVHSEEDLEEIGRKLYIKITEVVKAEIDSITEEDCINYVKDLVINKTFEGYITEKKTIYEQLQNLVGIEIKPAPDEWDREYNIDFFIEINNKFIGLQIKPITFNKAPQYNEKWKDIHETTSKKFSEEYGGKVFYIYSVKEGDQKKIYNKEIIDEIISEIDRLRNLN